MHSLSIDFTYSFFWKFKELWGQLDLLLCRRKSFACFLNTQFPIRLALALTNALFIQFISAFVILNPTGRF